MTTIYELIYNLFAIYTIIKMASRRKYVSDIDNANDSDSPLKNT